MSKMKQIAALTAMLVVVIMYASPAKSAVCFLPDDDGSCGGGDIEISDDSTSENQCADFNLSQNQRNSKEYDSDCYSCEPCTYNSRTTYKCALKNGATWYGGNLSVCCTNGEKYDSREGKCCPADGCVHECDAPKEWNSTSRRCVCPSGVETTTGVCCNDGEHADGAICCPEKKHNDGGVCKCDSQYNTDDDGNCIPQNNIKTTITVQYSLDMSRQDYSSWLNLTFKVLSASDAKSHHVELTFNPMDGAEPRNCTISYPLTFGTNTKTKVQCGSTYSMMNTPELTNISVDNSNVAASIRLDQLDNSTVQNDKYVIKLTKAAVTCPTGYKRGDIICAPGENRVEDSNISGCYKCEKVKTTITIAFSDVHNEMPLWLDDEQRYGNYYKTIKFTSKSSDNSSHKVELRTYPSATCAIENSTSSPVIVQENTKTVYVSECGSKTRPLKVAQIASIETYIDDKLVATHPISVSTYYPFVSENWFTSTLDGKSVTSGNYTIKYRAAKCSDWNYLNAKDECSGIKLRVVSLSGSDGACYSCTPSGSGSDPTCKPGTATIEYAYYYYYLPSTYDSSLPYFHMIPYGTEGMHPSITYTNEATKIKTTNENLIEKTTLNVKQDLAGNEDDSITYTYSVSFGNAHGGGIGITPDLPTMDTDMGNGKNITGGVKIDRPDSTRWACGAKMMTKADYTKATGLNEGGRLVGENAAGESMYFGDNTFHGVRLLNGYIGCAGEYVLVYGCRK